LGWGKYLKNLGKLKSMFYPTIPEKMEEPKLTDDSKSGFKKVNESRKESKMTNLTSDTNVKGTIKFGERSQK
jgi:hypothetical protein